MLINLLGNAVKFTDSGSVTFKVYASPSTDLQPDHQPFPTTTLRFQVEDTGIGMSPDQLEQIFLPFEQVSEAGKRPEGTGLGLTISQQIVTLMGSQIQVQSQPGEGSTFSVDLTVAISEGWQSLDNCLPESSANSQKIMGIWGKVPQVLIVEDNANHRAVLNNLLVSACCQTLEATDGYEGLRLAEIHHPDLILLDLAMPRMDGFELIAALQANSATQNIPLVVSSANVFEAERDRCLKAGAKSFLPKPVQGDELFDTIKTLLAVEWIYAEPDPQSTPVEKPVEKELTRQIDWLLPSQEVLQQLYHLAMMGDISGIETTLESLVSQDPQFTVFANEVGKLTATFQTKQIRQLLTAFMQTESHP